MKRIIIEWPGYLLPMFRGVHSNYFIYICLIHADQKTSVVALRTYDTVVAVANAFDGLSRSHLIGIALSTIPLGGILVESQPIDTGAMTTEQVIDSLEQATIPACLIPKAAPTAPRAIPSLATDPSLTDRQREIVRAIEASIADHGYLPTIRDLCRATGIRSPNGIVCHLKALAKKGILTTDPNRSRAIVLNHAGV